MTVTRAGRRGAAALGVLALVGFSASATFSNSPASAASNAAVMAKRFQFVPAEITVSSGTTVQWTNQDNVAHTVDSGTPGAPDKKFSGPMDRTGNTFSFQFKAPGTYAYYCRQHETMTGKVIVN